MSAVLNRLLWMWDEYPFVAGDTAVLQKSYALVAGYLGTVRGIAQGYPDAHPPTEDVRDADLLWQQLTQHRSAIYSLPLRSLRMYWQAAAREETCWESLRFPQPVPNRFPQRWCSDGCRRSPVCRCSICTALRNAPPTPPSTTPRLCQKRPCAFPSVGPYPTSRFTSSTKTCNLFRLGATGELCVSGACLVDGYLNLPELSAEHFIPLTDNGSPTTVYRTGDLARWRSDGQLELVGRRDYQVKIPWLPRGAKRHRSRADAAGRRGKMRRHAGRCRHFSQAAGRLHRAQNGRFAAHNAPRLLRDRLPGYMVPSDFFLLDAMPLGPTGKINRKALPAPEELQPELEETAVFPHDSSANYPGQHLAAVARTRANWHPRQLFRRRRTFTASDPGRLPYPRAAKRGAVPTTLF